MSQSVVTIRLNGHPYQIGCGPGEESHVAALGTEVETIMQSLIAAVGQIGEARLLAMVALILADRASTANNNDASTANNNDASTANNNDASTANNNGASTAGEDIAAKALVAAAQRITALASNLSAGLELDDKKP